MTIALGRSFLVVALAGTLAACAGTSAPGEGTGDVGSDLRATASGSAACTQRRLTFSADDLPNVPPAGSAFVWGGNATGGDAAPYADDFLASAKQAHQNGLFVFAYLEGPCGDTDGVDDGERDRCAQIHEGFNEKNAPSTPDTPQARWKPFTMAQLQGSANANVDYCEIDNLSNNVTIPLNPLLKEIKPLFDSGKVHCRIVLKNVEADDIDAIKSEVAPTPADANFIAPFHIYEDDNTSQKAELDAAMVRLKGNGAVTIISTDSDHYGSAFTDDKFLACK
jgi:hypothetical protein